MNQETKVHVGRERPYGQFRAMVPSEEHGAYAAMVSSWTRGAEHMLPKTTEDIMGFFAEGHAVLVFDGEELISHVAATYTYSDGAIELGAMYTNEAHRGRGAGTVAVGTLLGVLREKYPDTMVFALANPSSAKVFARMGAAVMSPEDLSEEVWQPCESCPKNPGSIPFHCCDTPYNLSSIPKTGLSI